ARIVPSAAPAARGSALVSRPFTRGLGAGEGGVGDELLAEGERRPRRRVAAELIGRPSWENGTPRPVDDRHARRRAG
ncbi:MAG: hypothetical protein V9H26_08080, partial [Verrucomicrobiota bacterium]